MSTTLLAMFVTLRPVAAGALILIGASVLVWAAVRSWLRWRGFRSLWSAGEGLARQLRGYVEREDGDLRIRGVSAGREVDVWFSKSEEKPGVRVALQVASTTVLICTPKNYRYSQGLDVKVQPVPSQEAGIQLLSNRPSEVRLFLSEPVIRELRKICASSGVVAVAKGRAELSEPAIPEWDIEQHVMSRISSLTTLGNAMDKMPEVRELRRASAPFLRRWSGYLEVAGVLGVVLLIAVFGRVPPPVAEVNVPTAASSGMPARELTLVPGLERWRVAQASDFDASAISWLRQAEQDPVSLLESGLGPEGSDIRAYALIATDGSGKARVVILDKDTVRFDTELPKLQLMARVPVGEFRRAQWNGGPPLSNPDGDGILLVQDYQNPHSALVLFISGVQVITLNPTDFKALNLR